MRDIRSTGNICFTCKKEIKFGAKNLFLGSDMEHSFYTWKEPCNREPPEGFRLGDKLCDKCYNSIPKQKPSKICYICTKKLGWKMQKFHICDIANPLVGGSREPPEGFRFLDRLCIDCHGTLPMKSKHVKSKKINTKYHTKKQKDCKLFQDGLTFEISHWKINGEPQHGNIGQLSSTKPFSYQFYVGKHGKFKISEWYQLFWFGELEKSIDHSEITHNIDECLTFEFDYNTGKLIIETKNNIHFEFQFKFQNQALIVDQFLKFINLRKYKISDKTIKEIKLKNNSKKIELRINKKELHEHEEVLANYSEPMTLPFEKDKPELLIRIERHIITNLRIMGDVWYYPAYFVNQKVAEVGFGQLEEIINFTHDQYDEILIKKDAKNEFYQDSLTFMSKGKMFWGLRNVKEPKRFVEMIKYAKSQFESQDDKIIEPVVSSSEDDPLKILKMRLAKGEITLEEFNEIKENLV